MGDSGQKSWWERNVEDPYWAQEDAKRAALYQNDPVARVKHDIGVGVEKGIYYGAKDMAVGLFEVAKWAVLLVAHDPETEKATTDAVVSGAKGAWKLAKDLYMADYGTPAEKQEVSDRWSKSVKTLGNAVSDKVKKDWDQASRDGKQAELVSKWVSRVGFEVAAFFVGAGEAATAAKTAKGAEIASELSKAGKLGGVASECADGARAVDEISDAAKGVKALEEAKGVKFTGARELKNTDFEGAERVYDDIRKSTTDVAAIAKNTEMSESRIQRIKDHLFNNNHALDDSVRRFDADPEIANAWARLERGTHTPKDVQLLEHELFESKFEGIFKTDYRTAHDAANRSGRPSGL